MTLQNHFRILFEHKSFQHIAKSKETLFPVTDGDLEIFSVTCLRYAPWLIRDEAGDNFLAISLLLFLFLFIVSTLYPIVGYFLFSATHVCYDST
jgi:hypothetical protein